MRAKKHTPLKAKLGARILCAFLAAATPAVICLPPQAQAQQLIARPPELDIAGQLVEAVAGQPFTFTFTLTNRGGAAATDIVLTPPVSLAPDNLNGDIIRIDSLSPGQSIELSFRALAQKEVPSAGTAAVTVPATYTYVALEDGQPKLETGKKDLTLAYRIKAASTLQTVYALDADRLERAYEANTALPAQVLSATLASGSYKAGDAVRLRVALLVKSGHTPAAPTLTSAAITYGAFSLEGAAPEQARASSGIEGFDLLYLDYAVKIGQAAASASHALSVSLEDTTRAFTIALSILSPTQTSAPGEHGVSVSGHSQQNTRPDGQNIVRWVVKVTNTSAKTVENLRLIQQNASAQALSMVGLPPVIKSLAPGATSEVTLAFYAAETLANGNHPLELSLEADGQTSLFNAFLLIDRPQTQPTTPPEQKTTNLRVAGFQTGGPIYKNTPFTLTFTIANPESSRAVSNLRVELESKVFSPVSGNRAMFIGKLLPGEESEQSLSLTIPAETELTTTDHVLALKLTYEDADGTSRTATLYDINLSISQMSKLQIYDVNFWGYEPNAPGQLYLYMMNEGGAGIFNLEASVSGQFSLSEEWLYLGNLGPSESLSPQVMVTPMQTGQVTGQLHLRYEDAQGQQHEVTRPFSGYVDEPYRPEPTPAPEPSGLGWKGWSMIGGAALIALIILLSLIGARRRRKRTEAFELEE